jgi:hypothetical protein
MVLAFFWKVKSYYFNFSLNYLLMQLRDHPALDLHNAYSLEGLAYQKKGSQVQRTVKALDYADMYLEHKTKFPDFAVFMRVIDQFFS